MPTLSNDNKEKRKQRAKQTAEVFTPPKLIKQMLNKLPKEVWKKGKTFLDPACGNGNFLISVLWRKLERGHDSLDALKSIYGVDIMKDNIQECRLRLLKLISLYEDIEEEHVQTVFNNIIYINQNKHRGGSLDYDFAFNSNRQSKQNIDRWLENIKNGKLLEINLPIDETEIVNENCIDIFSENREENDN